jgi:hypothetical protein
MRVVQEASLDALGQLLLKPELVACVVVRTQLSEPGKQGFALGPPVRIGQLQGRQVRLDDVVWWRQDVRDQVLVEDDALIIGAADLGFADGVRCPGAKQQKAAGEGNGHQQHLGAQAETGHIRSPGLALQLDVKGSIGHGWRPASIGTRSSDACCHPDCTDARPSDKVKRKRCRLHPGQRAALA